MNTNEYLFNVVCPDEATRASAAAVAASLGLRSNRGVVTVGVYVDTTKPEQCRSALSVLTAWTSLGLRVPLVAMSIVRRGAGDEPV